MDVKDQLLLDRQLSLIFTKGPVILQNAKFPSIPKIKVKRKISIDYKICDSNKCKENTTTTDRKHFGSRLELELTLSTHQNQTIPHVNLNALPETEPEPHTGLKPRRNLLQCRYCKSYKRSQNELTIHERVHTREQPFKCKHCSKRFTWEETWRRHEMNDCESKCIPKNETNTTAKILTSKASSATATRIKQNQIGSGKNQKEIVNKGTFTRRRSRKPVRYNYSSDSDVLSCDSDDDSWKRDVFTASSLKSMRKKSKKDKQSGSEVSSWTPSAATVKGAGAGAQLRSLSTPVQMRKQTVCSSSTNDKTRADGTTWDRKAGGHLQGFICFNCKKVFSLKANLKVHERTHTGEQPYYCTSCNARFKQLSGLNYHLNQSKKSSCSKIANK